MITVGIISTFTVYDQAMMLVNCLVLAILFAYLVNSVGTTIIEMNTCSDALNQRIRQANYFLRTRDISDSLR